MILLGDEFGVLRDVADRGPLAPIELDSRILRVLIDHRLLIASGDHLALTIRGRQVLERGVAKTGSGRDYVHVPGFPDFN